MTRSASLEKSRRRQDSHNYSVTEEQKDVKDEQRGHVPGPQDHFLPARCQRDILGTDRKVRRRTGPRRRRRRGHGQTEGRRGESSLRHCRIGVE